MKKVTKYVVGVAVALGLVGGVVAANNDGYSCRGGGMAKHGDRMVKKVTKRLDLNESQQMALKQLQGDLQTKMQAMHANKADSKAAFMNLFGTQFDQAGAVHLVQTKTSKVEQNAPDMISSFANFYDSLDQAQQDKIVKMLEKRGGKRFGLFGMGKGHHDNHDAQDDDSHQEQS